MQFHAENDRRNIRPQFDNLAATHASQLGDVEAKIAARLDILEAHAARNAQRMDQLMALVEQLLEGR